MTPKREALSEAELDGLLKNLDWLSSPAAEAMDDGARLTALCHAANNAAKAIRALQAPSSEWRDIATAPKDSTRVLLLCLEPEGFEQAIAFYDDEWRAAWDGLPLASYTLKPMGWLPLPPTPQGDVPGADVFVQNNDGKGFHKVYSVDYPPNGVTFAGAAPISESGEDAYAEGFRDGANHQAQALIYPERDMSGDFPPLPEFDLNINAPWAMKVQPAAPISESGVCPHCRQWPCVCAPDETWTGPLVLDEAEISQFEKDCFPTNPIAAGEEQMRNAVERMFVNATTPSPADPPIEKERACTCHPDDRKHYGLEICQKRYATRECIRAAGRPDPYEPVAPIEKLIEQLEAGRRGEWQPLAIYEEAAAALRSLAGENERLAHINRSLEIVNEVVNRQKRADQAALAAKDAEAEQREREFASETAIYNMRANETIQSYLAEIAAKDAEIKRLRTINERFDTEIDAMRELKAEIAAKDEALEKILKRHCELVESGDCGHWDVESEDEVKAARAALRGQ